MIKTAKFLNFKGLQNVALELERLTVIVGPNASGKTSILEALQYLSESHIPFPASVHYRNNQGDINLCWSGENWDSWINMSSKKSRQRADDDSAWELTTGGNIDGNKAQFWPLPPKNIGLIEYIPTASLLRFEASRLAAPSYSFDQNPVIDSQGNGLATYLAWMALNQPDNFHDLQLALTSIVPSVKRIRFDRKPIVQNRPEIVNINGERLIREHDSVNFGDSILFDVEGAQSIPGHLASEGSILVLGLLAKLMGPDRPSLILLDDLERGLHPRAQKELVTVLRRFLEQNSKVQIIATTHSPLLLNHINAREVRLTTLESDGSTACGRMDEHPSFEEWKEAMAPGEFWSLIGEQWLRGHSELETPG